MQMACCLANALQVPCVSNHVGVTAMKRLYQGHLHPKLEVPDWHVPVGIRTWASCVGSEHSRKEPSRQLVSSYSEHLHMSPRMPWQVEQKLIKWMLTCRICSRRNVAKYSPSFTADLQMTPTATVTSQFEIYNINYISSNFHLPPIWYQGSTKGALSSYPYLVTVNRQVSAFQNGFS